MASLPYTQWLSKTWKVKTNPGGVSDVGVDDLLTFSLDNSVPDKKIRIASFTCNDTGTPHDAQEWTGYCEKVSSTEVKGWLTTSGKEFRIESSERVEKGKTINKLHWRVIASKKATPGGEPDGPGSTGGGTCWTAEDG